MFVCLLKRDPEAEALGLLRQVVKARVKEEEEKIVFYLVQPSFNNLSLQFQNKIILKIGLRIGVLD